MTGHDHGGGIEEGRKDRAPVAARFCLKCRSGQRGRHNLKYNWLPQHEAYMRAHHRSKLLGVKRKETSRLRARRIKTPNPSFPGPTRRAKEQLLIPGGIFRSEKSQLGPAA